MPPSVVTITLSVPASSPRPEMTSTPSFASRLAMSADWSEASCLTRRLSRPRSTVTVVAASPSWSVSRTPSSADPATSVIRSDVAIRVLLGTQSVSTAEPPSPSRSTTVTYEPSWAATSAASYPPGPPPMTTIR